CTSNRRQSRPPSNSPSTCVTEATELDVEVVDCEVDPAGEPVSPSDSLQRSHEESGLAIRACEGQALSGERLDDAENVCRPAAHVLVVGASELARHHRQSRSRVFAEDDRPLVEANDRLSRIQLTGVQL